MSARDVSHRSSSASRVPIVTRSGRGLADFLADTRAVTPANAPAVNSEQSREVDGHRDSSPRLPHRFTDEPHSECVGRDHGLVFQVERREGDIPLSELSDHADHPNGLTLVPTSPYSPETTVWVGRKNHSEARLYGRLVASKPVEEAIHFMLLGCGPDLQILGPYSDGSVLVFCPQRSFRDLVRDTELSSCSSSEVTDDE